MKVTTITLQQGEPIRVWGEVELDIIHNALIVRGEDGNYISFYWPFVAYYAVTEAPGGPPVGSAKKEPQLTH
jgi:hypothetical protein